MPFHMDGFAERLYKIRLNKIKETLSLIVIECSLYFILETINQRSRNKTLDYESIQEETAQREELR